MARESDSGTAVSREELIERARTLLGSDADGLSDENIEQLIAQARVIARGLLQQHIDIEETRRPR